MPKTLTEKLKAAKLPKALDGPVWKGPEVDGVTQSMLQRFLCCRERFRVQYILGWKAAESFNPAIEYGQMWHACEEALSSEDGWEARLKGYVFELTKKYPMNRDSINEWYNKCLAQFPVYIEYWSKHKDVTERTPLLQEQVFDVPYRLPSGRTVRLRGKWDAVDLIGKGKNAGVYLQENKTKSAIDQGKIQRQMGFDLQTMMYLTTMELDETGMWQQLREKYKGQGRHPFPIKGVRYNVIRRSAHKSAESMMEKINADLKANRGGEWFARWKVEIGPADVAKFRRECLDPILEQLCHWYKWCSLGEPFRPKNDGLIHHWRHPFGVRNILDEGGSTDLDAYLDTGSTVGLVRNETLFTELQ